MQPASRRFRAVNAETLGIEQDLSKRDFRALLELDYFEIVDRKINVDLVQGAMTRTPSAGDVRYVCQRRQGHWYVDYTDLYSAIEVAAAFIYTLEGAQPTMTSLADGVQKYTRSRYKLDQLYRKFIFHARQSAVGISVGGHQHASRGTCTATSSCSSLTISGKRLYVDNAPLWDAPPIVLQRRFFEHWVRPFVERQGKVCVLISDAFRYEIGGRATNPDAAGRSFRGRAGTGPGHVAQLYQIGLRRN